jgi:hypothetical protein
MAELHRAVIDALKVTFSEAKFEEHLRDQAADTEQVAARRAERENLIQQIPKLAAAEAKLAKVIAVTDDVDALVAELKATQQERRQAEARVADLEGYERDLRDQQEQVERLRRVWGGWAAGPGRRRADGPADPQEDPAGPHLRQADGAGRLAVRGDLTVRWRPAGRPGAQGASRRPAGLRPAER